MSTNVFPESRDDSRHVKHSTLPLGQFLGTATGPTILQLWAQPVRGSFRCAQTPDQSATIQAPLQLPWELTMPPQASLPSPAIEAPVMVARGYSLVEGPVWDAASAQLLFCDGLDGGVWALGSSGDLFLALPKRRCSGLALHAAGGLVASGRNVGWKHGNDSARLLELDPSWGMAFFNDLGTDHAGRVYVGSVDYDPEHPDRIPRPGYLHLIDLDGSSRIVADGIGIANGVAASPDGSLLYFNDTHHRLVRRYATRGNGDLIETEPLIGYPDQDDQPDGIAIATDGTVWIALAASGCISIVTPAGKEIGRIAIPDGHHVSSLCFGDSDLSTLFVTTIHKTANGENDSAVFRMRVRASGLPVPPARIALSPIREGQ